MIHDDGLVWISTPDGRCLDCGHLLTAHYRGGLCKVCAVLEEIVEEYYACG
jgi:hypothetical protein